MDTFRNRGNQFPNRNDNNSRKTSCESPEYNCFGWAITGIETLFGPDKVNGWIWPSNVPRNQRLESFVAAAAEYGFSRCDNGDAEAGFEKIVLYGAVDWVDHAARQLKNGRWTSRLGIRGEDIEHDTPEVVSGRAYGPILAFLKRPLAAFH